MKGLLCLSCYQQGMIPKQGDSRFTPWSDSHKPTGVTIPRAVQLLDMYTLHINRQTIIVTKGCFIVLHALYCEDFAGSQGLIFNASKMQFICFGPQPSTSCSANIRFFDATLPFCDVVHLGHLLCHDLSDSQQYPEQCAGSYQEGINNVYQQITCSCSFGAICIIILFTIAAEPSCLYHCPLITTRL